jgi:multicomponent Na+:H+ antiporter subunit B
VSRELRFWVLGVGVVCFGTILVLAFLAMPPFGTSHHPYRDLAVPASVAHGSANVISSVNFDQRAIDTLGEETILFGSVIAVAALLRPAENEETKTYPGQRVPFQATRMFGYVLMPVTLIIGVDLVVHGQVTPGGGFQGGVVLATGLHLLYVAGRYRSMEKLRPMPLVEVSEAAGTAAFAALGFAGIGITGAFLANVLPFGTFGQLLSAGTVPLFNVGVGVAVASGCVVLLAKFFEQVFLVEKDGGTPEDGGS